MAETWNAYNLANMDGLRRLLHSYHALETLASNGDVDSATILCDINEAMQYGGDKRIITERQRYAISLLLIDGNDSNTVAQIMGITPRNVFKRVEQGLQRMLRYMQHRETSTRWGRGHIVQQWQYDYVLRNANLSPRQLAVDLGKTVSAIHNIRHKLRGKGFIVGSRRNYRRRSQSKDGLAERRVSGADNGSVEESA